MKRIGKIISYGNYNSKKGSYNDFGFIDDGEQEIFFHKSALNILKNIILEDRWVSFYLEKIHEKSRAINIELLDQQDVVQFSKYFETVNWNRLIENSSPFNLLIKFLFEIDIITSEKIIRNKTKDLSPKNRQALFKALYQKSFPSLNLMKDYLTKKYLLSYIIKNHKLLINKVNREKYFEMVTDLLLTVEGEKKWKEIMLSDIKHEKAIWEVIPTIYKIEILLEKIDDSSIAEISRLIAGSENNASLTKILPEKVKSTPEIFTLLPSLEKIKILCTSAYHNIPNYQNEIYIIFYSLPASEKEEAISIIPNNLHRNQDIFPYLSAEEQLGILPSIEDNLFITYWDLSKRQTKISYIFKCCMHTNPYLPINSDANDKVVSLLLKMLRFQGSIKEKQTLFFMFHNALQDDIVSIAWDLNAEINYSPLFPECPNGIVRYCEGRPWRKSIAYCPRIANSCLLNNSSIEINEYYDQFGARISPDYDSLEWSLLEFLSYLKYVPKLYDLNDSKEYVNRMAGWINRLIEIRSRMKCRTCGSPLISNKEYSKNLARYSATIFNCEGHVGHDKNVYINHCWACENIIDSRDSKIRDNSGFYLCINCGSGSPINRHLGSICPQCGNIGLERLSDKILWCPECNHEMKIPRKLRETNLNSNIEEE